ncbi:MAG: hypothetical protein EA376_00070, partial [Phycisphaeraceae bacterium]
MSDLGFDQLDAVAEAVASLLRSIPERWTTFDEDALTAVEQRALFLLVAAGLVERRFALRVEMAGQPGAIDASASATGERGLAEALEPLLAELWTRWSDAFKSWKSGEAADASPFRVSRDGSGEWRLTEHGVMARADLDVETPSEGASAFVGCRQRTLDFVLRTGRQRHRPAVDGAGRLIRLADVRAEAAPEQTAPAAPTQVSLANAGEIAAAFRDALLPEIVEALQSQRHTDDANANAQAHDETDADTELPPSLSENQITIMRTMA